ncbi:MAG: glycosyltransferase [Patescibacteria group bacterium]
MKIIALTPVLDKCTIANMVIQGLNDLGHNVIATNPGNSVINHYDDNEVIEHSKDADYIFVFWDKGEGNSQSKYSLLNRINRPEITAYIDESEWTSTGVLGDELSPAYWITPERGILNRIKASLSRIKAFIYGRKDLLARQKGFISRQKVEAKYNPRRCKGDPWLNDKMFNYCMWYFKRECYPEDVARGIIPLNIGCWNEYFSNLNIKKDIDILCSFGQLDTGLRYEVYHFCKKLEYEGYKVKFIGMGKQKVDFKTYLELIARSFIGLSAWGAGNSCRRLYETMAGRTCCFAQKTEIEFVNKPEDGVHYVEYSNMAEFMDKIYYYLNNRKLCSDIGKRGYDFVKKYHTGAARVHYMLDIMSPKKKKTE